LLFALAFATATGFAQEAIRSSLAGEAAAEARRRANQTPGYYNLKLGPTFWRFEAGLGLEYNSNVQNRSDQPEDDFIVRPELNLAFRWPVSELNTLVLDAGIGYAKYIDNTDLDRLYIRPGTQLSFDIYSGDFRVNLHDRLEIRQETYQNPLVAGTGDYQRLENTVGVTVDWDLNELILTAGFDHGDYVNLGDDQWPDGRTESVFARAGWLVSSTVTAGFESGGSLIRYRDNDYTDGEQFSAGGFAAGDVTEYITARAGVGVTGSLFDDDRYDPYGYLGLQHRVNASFGYSLTGGREIRSGLQWARTAEVVDTYYVTWQPNWTFIRDWSLGTPVFYQHVIESGGINDETVDQYGVGARVQRVITEHLTAGLEYRYIYRDSNLPNQDYDIHSVLLRLGYKL
jgi:opacity protein-like surface antigen